jgi:hypothetical protein
VFPSLIASYNYWKSPSSSQAPPDSSPAISPSYGEWATSSPYTTPSYSKRVSPSSLSVVVPVHTHVVNPSAIKPLSALPSPRPALKPAMRRGNVVAFNRPTATATSTLTQFSAVSSPVDPSSSPHLPFVSAHPEPAGTCRSEPRLVWAIASIAALSVFAHACIGIYFTRGSTHSPVSSPYR